MLISRFREAKEGFYLRRFQPRSGDNNGALTTADTGPKSDEPEPVVKAGGVKHGDHLVHAVARRVYFPLHAEAVIKDEDNVHFVGTVFNQMFGDALEQTVDAEQCLVGNCVAAPNELSCHRPLICIDRIPFAARFIGEFRLHLFADADEIEVDVVLLAQGDELLGNLAFRLRFGPRCAQP